MKPPRVRVVRRFNSRGLIERMIRLGTTLANIRARVIADIAALRSRGGEG